MITEQENDIFVCIFNFTRIYESYCVVIGKNKYLTTIEIAFLLQKLHRRESCILFLKYLFAKKTVYLTANV